MPTDLKLPISRGWQAVPTSEALASYALVHPPSTSTGKRLEYN